MLITLATPTKKILVDQELEEVFVPADKGELNILPGHAPLVSTLVTGVLRYKLKGDDKEHKVVISWGFLEISGDHVTILAETAEKEEEVDATRAEEAYKVAQERLNMAGLATEDLEKYQRKLRRAEVRMNVKDL